MAEDWSAVARVINERLNETRKTQMDVASRANVSLTTFRELQHNTNPRRRRPQTLAAISEALGLPSGYLGRVLNGEASDSGAADVPADGRLSRIESELATLRERVERLESAHRGN